MQIMGFESAKYVATELFSIKMSRPTANVFMIKGFVREIKHYIKHVVLK